VVGHSSSSIVSGSGEIALESESPDGLANDTALARTSTGDVIGD